MALKNLINKQTIIIDDHKRGSGEVKNWDDKSVDVHIDKMTNYPVKGEKQNIRIRVPINSDRPILIESAKKERLNEIPRQLKREIQRAFDNKGQRDNFINDIIEHLKNFDTILSTEERVKQVLANISKHFDLEWTNEIISNYTDDILSDYTQTYTDINGLKFYIKVDKKKIIIAQNNGFARRKKNIRR